MSETEKTTVKQRQIQYQNQYNKEHYERICVRIPKEKDISQRIAAVAKQQGISSTAFIIKAIEKELEWYE